MPPPPTRVTAEKKETRKETPPLKEVKPAKEVAKAEQQAEKGAKVCLLQFFAVHLQAKTICKPLSHLKIAIFLSHEQIFKSSKHFPFLLSLHALFPPTFF